MNRFKFRVWNPRDKSFNDEVWLYQSGELDHDTVLHSNFKSCVVQQFTGLKDKNGLEIFEGDIVKYSRCRLETVESPKGVFSSRIIEMGDEIGRIIFIFPSFCWSYDYKRHDDIEEMTLASHRYEVIGNIFENPELLK